MKQSKITQRDRYVAIYVPISLHYLALHRYITTPYSSTTHSFRRKDYSRKRQFQNSSHYSVQNVQVTSFDDLYQRNATKLVSNSGSVK